MNYSTIFATSAAAERFFQKVFSVQTAIALSVFVFELARDAYESGQMVRGWCEISRAWYAANREAIACEFAPCVDAGVAAIAWVFGGERCWSAERLPVTLVANAEFWSEIKADYLEMGNCAVQSVVAFTNVACRLSTAGVRAIAG
jgi:hypothetical protein